MRAFGLIGLFRASGGLILGGLGFGAFRASIRSISWDFCGHLGVSVSARCNAEEQLLPVDRSPGRSGHLAGPSAGMFFLTGSPHFARFGPVRPNSESLLEPAVLGSENQFHVRGGGDFWEGRDGMRGGGPKP